MKERLFYGCDLFVLLMCRNMLCVESLSNNHLWASVIICITSMVFWKYRGGLFVQACLLKNYLCGSLVGVNPQRTNNSSKLHRNIGIICSHFHRNNMFPFSQGCLGMDSWGRLEWRIHFATMCELLKNVFGMCDLIKSSGHFLSVTSADPFFYPTQKQRQSMLRIE